MSILSDNQIINMINNGFIGIEPLIKNNIQPSSVDLTLSDQIEIVTTKNSIDLGSLAENAHEFIERQTISDDGYSLEPNSYVIGFSAEIISLTTGFNGRICNKNSLIRWGLDVSLGSFINPGFKGRMPLIIRNIGKSKLILRKGIKICQLEIHQLDTPSTRNYENRHDSEVLISDIPEWEKKLQQDNKNLDRSFSEFLHQRIIANSK